MTIHAHGQSRSFTVRAREAMAQAEDDPLSFLRDGLEQKIAEIERTHTRFRDWSMRVPEPKSGTLNFRRFPFQKELYDEGSDEPEMVVKKSTQVGVSALLVRWTMYHADRGLTSLYVFPRLKQMYDFCCHADERVLTANGGLKRIAEMAVGDRVLSSPDGERVVEDEVVRVWERGQRPILRVSIEGGGRLRLTAQHRVRAERGWVEAGDLMAGDLIAVPNVLPEPVGEDLDPADAFLMALWLAEGSKTRSGFTFTCANPEIRAKAKAIARRRGWRVYEGERYSMALTMKHERSVRTPAGFLREHGLRAATDAIAIPDAIMRAARPAALEFLRTYIACDGHVPADPLARGGGTEITVASASERLIRDLRVLAARLGIPGTVRSHLPQYEGAKRCWTWAAAQMAAREQLAGMGVPGKLERLEVPARPPASAAWRRVVVVEPNGEAETYDLETRDHHSFFLEGALTHNSDARIKNVILASEYLRERIPPLHVQNKGLKQIGLGFVYYRGSEAVEQLDSVDADALALDEYDTLTQQNIPAAERRISGSESPMMRRVGVPSIPQYGIARLYDESDQRRWFVKCPACGTQQHLTFHDNVDQIRKIRICAKCTSSLEGDPLLDGQWVAEFPDRTVRGYAIPRLVVPGVNLGQIIEASKQRAPYRKQAFYNRDLGEEYAPAEGRLSPEVIAACQREFRNGPKDVGYRGANLVTMGVDVATVRNLNVRISEHISENEKKALWIGEAESFDEVCNLMARFDVKMAAIDHEPEGRLARSLAERFPGRVYVVNYSAMQRDVMMVDEQQRRASVRRVEAIDSTMEMFRQQRNLLPIDLPHDYVDHMQAAVRFTETDDLGKVTVAYRKIADDDYLHAEVYDLIATELWWLRQTVEESQREVFQPLDNMLEFQRSTVNDPDDVDYSPGFELDDDYSPGPDDASDVG